MNATGEIDKFRLALTYQTLLFTFTGLIESTITLVLFAEKQAKAIKGLLQNVVCNSPFLM